MKIVVIGGSGLIGTKLVNKLRQLGHEVAAASPAEYEAVYYAAEKTPAMGAGVM